MGRRECVVDAASEPVASAPTDARARRREKKRPIARADVDADVAHRPSPIARRVVPRVGVARVAPHHLDLPDPPRRVAVDARAALAEDENTAIDRARVAVPVAATPTSTARTDG